MSAKHMQGENNMKKKILVIAIIVILVVILTPIIWYNLSITPVDKDNKEKISIEIPIGSSSEDIAEILKDNDIIKNKLAFKIYVKLNKVSNFKAGKYDLYQTMDLKEITKTLQTGTLYVENQVAITFIEGKHMRWYANKIAQTTNNTEEQVFELLENEEYMDSLIEKYWFLTEEIKNENVYYPLEGYLFPDTYFFENKDVTVEEIFEVLLNQTEKVLNEYKEQIEAQEYSVHEILALASIIETEAVFVEDRKDISSVIYNRLNKNMPIQSDVTTYYGIQVDMGDRALFQSELDAYNPYNTRGPRMEGKLPIGPISSVSKDAIDAALNPSDTDYIYFVADKNGKVYFTKTLEEHTNKITQLENEGLWYEF